MLSAEIKRQQPMSRPIREVLLDFLFPPLHPCPGCGREDTLITPAYLGLCDRCHEAFPWAAPKSLPPDVLVPARYESGARALIFQLKYREAQYIAPVMAKAMADCFCESEDAADNWTIIPVPLHTKREKKRGYNQSKLLAKHVSLQLNLPYEPGALFRNRPTAPMYRLNRMERILNTAGSISLNPSVSQHIENKNILLVDDIYTTGATANACIQTLLTAGAAHVKVLAFALADLDDHPNLP